MERGMALLILAFVGQCLGQMGSSCAIANRHLYIMGGLVNGEPNTKLINLDLRVPFAVNNFSLQSPQVSVFNLGSEAYVPSYSTLFTTAANDSKLWTFGSLGGTPLGLRYFDLDRSQWEPSLTINQGPSSRAAFAWAHYNDTQYLYGGSITKNRSFTNEFWQLQAGYMGSWKSMPILDSAPAVQYHQSVVVNGRFIVLGGQLADGTIRDLSQVWVFDLKKNTWHVQATVGGLDMPMVKFTPLGTNYVETSTNPLAYNNSIIIQGGANGINPKAKHYKLYSQLFMLDTDNWTWKIIQLASTSARASYSAWMIENQLVQFLGEVKGSPTPLIQIISLLDFTVSNNYSPPHESWFDQLIPVKDQRKEGVSSDFVVVIAAGILATVLLPLLVVSLVRRRRAKLYLKKHPPKPNNPTPAYRPNGYKPPTSKLIPQPSLSDFEPAITNPKNTPTESSTDLPILASRTATTAPNKPLP